MTGEATSGAPETDTEVPPDATAGETSVFRAPGRTTAVLAASAVALVIVATETVVNILANVPFDPVVASPAVRAVTGALAPVAVAAALVTIAVADDRATVRVGLLFAAVFGCLALVAPTTTLTAVVALVGGATLGLVGTLGMPEERTYCGVRRRVLAIGFVAALALTLAAATGLFGGVRSLGAVLSLVAVAAVGTHSGRSRFAAGAGLLAAGALVAASAMSPFVLGSALLVAFAVTGVPHVLVALAVAGVVAAVVAGLRRGEYALAVGALLLLLAGVPATLPRAMTFLLGATLVLLEIPTPTGRPTSEVPG